MLLWEGRQFSAQQACYLPSLSRYPFIHLGREDQPRVKCLAQGHNTRTFTGFEPTTLGSWVRNSTAELRASLFKSKKIFKSNCSPSVPVELEWFPPILRYLINIHECYWWGIAGFSEIILIQLEVIGEQSLLNGIIGWIQIHMHKWFISFTYR